MKPIRIILSVAALTAPIFAHAQASAAPQMSQLPKVCAEGVREFYQRAELSMVKYDTLTMPPMDGPMRVTSPEEAEAAQRMMREKAGSVGATGLLVLEETHDDGNGRVQMSRNVTPVYMPSDTARAYAACRKEKPARR